MKVKSLIASDVKCCAIHDTLSTAAQIIWDNDVGAMLVVDEEGRICGVVTDRDISLSRPARIAGSYFAQPHAPPPGVSMRIRSPGASCTLALPDSFVWVPL